MKKLTDQSPLNSPESYDEIYRLRVEKGVDSQDVRRWKKLVNHYVGGRVIDFGCLDSLVPELIHTKNRKGEVWGIDLASQAIEAMRKRFPWAYFEVRDVYDTGFPDGYFSYGVAGELCEHLERPEAFIKEAMRVIKSGGTLALSVPKDEAIEPGAVDGERHLWSYSIEDIKSLLEPYGKVEIKTIGSQFIPVYEYHWPSIIAYCKKT